MSSLFKAFSQTQNRAMVYAVQFPLTNPTVELTVNRIPRPIDNAADIAATGTMNEIHFPKDSPSYDSERWAWKAYHLVPYIVDHTTDWKSLVEGEEAPKFSRAELEKIVAEFGVEDRKILGVCYLSEVAKDLKKATGEASSEQAS